MDEKAAQTLEGCQCQGGGKTDQKPSWQLFSGSRASVFLVAVIYCG